MEPQLSLMLPNIRSCHNVGSMFRTADCLGFGRLYLCGYTATPPKVQIDKVALGAETWIPWEHYQDPIECVEAVRARGVQVVALEKTKNSIPITALKVHPPMMLIVGNEVTGIDEDILAAADSTVHIPMYGQKESLNVSIAAGIAMHYFKTHI